MAVPARIQWENPTHRFEARGSPWRFVLPYRAFVATLPNGRRILLKELNGAYTGLKAKACRRVLGEGACRLRVQVGHSQIKAAIASAWTALNLGQIVAAAKAATPP